MPEPYTEQVRISREAEKKLQGERKKRGCAIGRIIDEALEAQERLRQLDKKQLGL